MQPAAEAPEPKLLILLPHIDSRIRLRIRARVAMVAAIVKRKQQVKGGGDLVMQSRTVALEIKKINKNKWRKIKNRRMSRSWGKIKGGVSL